MLALMTRVGHRGRPVRHDGIAPPATSRPKFLPAPTIAHRLGRHPHGTDIGDGDQPDGPGQHHGATSTFAPSPNHRSPGPRTVFGSGRRRWWIRLLAQSNRLLPGSAHNLPTGEGDVDVDRERWWCSSSARSAPPCHRGRSCLDEGRRLGCCCRPCRREQTALPARRRAPSGGWTWDLLVRLVGSGGNEEGRRPPLTCR